MKKLFYLFLLLSSFQLTAQTLPKLLSVNSAGGNASDVGYSIYSDKYGNNYVTGVFGLAADFDSSPAVANLFSAGGGDIFVVKYNKLGQYMWAINFGSTAWDYGYDICGDSLGNIYVTGFFTGTADFDPGPGTASLTSAGSDDVFVVKFNSNGQYQWAFNIGSTNSDKGFGIRCDASNNVYIFGSIQGAADFDPSPASVILSGVFDGYLAKYNSSGQFQWAFNMRIGATYHPLAVDPSGNCYIGTGFSTVVDFDPGPGTTTITPAASGSAALICYNSAGQFQWVDAFGSSAGSVRFQGIALDSAKNIYLTGYMQGNIDVDPSAVSNSITAVGSQDIFIGKYDKLGQYQWAYSLGKSSGSNNGIGIAADLTGNFYISGLLGGADLDPSPSVAMVNPIGGSDAFLAKYNTSGQYQYGFNIGGTISDGGYATSADNYGNGIVSGTFQDPNTDFDPNTPVVYSPYITFSDFFVASYGACTAPLTPTNTTVNSTICSGQSATLNVTNTGNIYWYATPTSTVYIGYGATYSTPTLTTGVSASTYTYYAQVQTCTVNPVRTIVTITVNPLPIVNVTTTNTLICVGQTATLSASGANTYTWNPGGPGNNISISPTVTSTYTLLGKDANNCTSTTVFTQSVSACTGINEIISVNSFSIYPNPNNGSFNLQLDSEIENGELILFNVIGQKVFSQKIKQGNNEIKMQGLAKGLYHYSILQNKTQIQTGKIVIE